MKLLFNNINRDVYCLFKKGEIVTALSSDIHPDTLSASIYTQCMTKSGIPLQHVISCAVDRAPAMMGNRKGLLQDDNPDMLTVHCVIHREHLVAKQLSPEVHTVMKAAITCINLIKANAKQERLFKDFCSQMDDARVQLLYTQRCAGYQRETGWIDLLSSMILSGLPHAFGQR